ncbi:MAG TPA: helix-turn-helix domain-containing protein [Gemmatimonadales bacterium]|nr:helix-turn-helix domain-containing protein [Gemmatimonadales bacterium]
MTVHSVGGYAEFPPPLDLADALEALWIHETSSLQHVVHRVVPDAAVSLCFTGSRANDGSRGGTRLRLIGPVTRPRPFTPPPGHRMEAVRIKLEWSLPLLGVAPWEFADRDPLYADAQPDLAAPLEARLAETTKSADALALLVEFVRARRSRVAGAGTLLIAGMESLRRGARAPRVAELAGRLGVSDRHLRRLMVDATGISPRHFARIQRFHALLRSADLAPRPAWARLAAHHGYADQSHLIREVQDLAGTTPARLHGERRAEETPTGAR